MHKLVVCCLTYNHAPFIRQTLDGMLAQKTSFDFQIVVHDDASTDETTAIINEYERKYPDKIKAIYQKENQYSKGVDVLRRVLADIRCEYLALCDGDDYWTDNTKLQQQVDFLDRHPDYAICFHKALIRIEDVNECVKKKRKYFPARKKTKGKTTFQLKDILERNIIPTTSVMYRWRFNDGSLGSHFPPDISPTDYFLHVLHAENGKIGYIPKVMAVYRKHAGGIWCDAGKSNAFFAMHGLRYMRFYDELAKRYGCTLKRSHKRFAYRLVLSYLQQKRYDLLQSFAQQYPELYAMVLADIAWQGVWVTKIRCAYWVGCAVVFLLLVGYLLFKLFN